jgi:hypothetical protein
MVDAFPQLGTTKSGLDPPHDAGGSADRVEAGDHLAE